MPKYQDPNFDKKTYWERRSQGLRGTAGYVQVVQTIRDDDGNIKDVVPISGKRPPRSNRYGRGLSAYEANRQAIVRNRNLAK